MATGAEHGAGAEARAEARVDGRIQRSERSREAIVQALLDLVGEGVLEPTAQQVAERANVGVRSVFRHFSDMDTLFAEMNERLSADVNALLVDDERAGPIADRIDGLIERRARIFTHIAPYRRATAVQLPRSAYLRDQREVSLGLFRRDLALWIPEVTDLDAETADAIEVALSFESWDYMRSDLKLGAKRAQAVMQRTVRALLRL